ncbi:transcriptional regulator [Virgibacillus profundi]|uniref:Transcriptional regulator n=1 Tax=Virgibacillus profundi TaxID=2024555 RepID=A0A2A2I9K1_9BACI|nr:DUF4188 domain-containing protein [Virgibacillus profundi]PAV28048.1 transcriptional regulator [Virgibacillus profundi]PXY52352.1 DUF4188 domain-containing protein [Virgibacillus profundi]
MAKSVFEGRYTTENDQDIVVFLIGMRVNKWHAVHKWLPVFMAMPAMIRELYQNKDLGLLSMESYFGLRTTVMIQYWQSTEDLHAYARGQKHLTAWRDFNKKVGDNEAVGIYHETYIVQKGDYETVYGNMPLYGLAKTRKQVPVDSSLNSAKKRLNTKKA